MGTKLVMKPVNRRDIMRYAGTGAMAAIVASIIPGMANADAKMVAESMKKLIGDKTPKEGKVTLEVPQIAENGRTVPIAFEVDSPMTEADHVKAVHIFADQNPVPDVATFNFTPSSGKARVAIRVRLAKTQNIVAVAEMSDGSVYMGKAPVKVTIGGCGG